MAESVKALQNRGHTPCSPKTLRRAHSVASPYQQPQQQQQQQQQQQKTREQIYAPVAHLQQKIAQREAQQQMLLQQHQQQHQQCLSPDGDKYGFGMKFQTHQSHFYQQMVDGGVPMLSPPGEQQQQQVVVGSVRYMNLKTNLKTPGFFGRNFVFKTKIISQDLG